MPFFIILWFLGPFLPFPTCLPAGRRQCRSHFQFFWKVANLGQIRFLSKSNLLAGIDGHKQKKKASTSSIYRLAPLYFLNPMLSGTVFIPLPKLPQFPDTFILFRDNCILVELRYTLCICASKFFAFFLFTCYSRAYPHHKNGLPRGFSYQTSIS